MNLITTGQGQIYPYRIRELVAGLPSSTIVNIESEVILRANATASNGVLPVATFPTAPVLPNGSPGNQYVQMKFSHKVQVESVLSDLLANATTNSGLTTAVSLLAYDPNSEATIVLKGRGFVGGVTFFNRSGVLERIQAVDDQGGQLVILDSEASGFPRGFTNDIDLVDEKSFVFVADSDNDLDTIETFDPLSENLLVRIIVTNAVRDTENGVLEQELCTATTVGDDPNPPDVLGWTSTNPLQIFPGNGQTGVDPLTTVTIRFNKPVQPSDVGSFFSATSLTPASGGVALNVTVSALTFGVLYYADPQSYGDLCNYVITPAYSMPGETKITVAVNAPSVHGLVGPVLGNDAITDFTTGVGPGIVNAPVAPDAIYVGIGGSEPGVAVIDLNGYGQGTNGLDPDPLTGQPTKSPNDTAWPRNPNIGKAGVTPPLSNGTSTLDAGSNGPLTLVQDTKGNTRLLRSPFVGSVTDIHIGAPLDIVFNNFNVNTNANGANQVNVISQAIMPGNSITVAPQPNPPRLVFPPPNPSRAIFGEEPTVTSSQGAGLVTASPPCQQMPINLLVGAALPGYSTHFAEGVFYGPQSPPASPPPPPPYCPYTSRQQIGHFLYCLDSENRRILVLNSNRFTVLDTISLSNPVNMSMAPTLGLLAVTNFASSTVSFIDVDPRSPSFNTVVGETRVSRGPGPVSWQPDGEAILVLSPPSNTLTVLSAGDFSIQSVVSGNVNDPISLAVTERYVTTGNLSGVYYAYILNKDGTIAVYESGPAGVNGIGFDDMIGTVDLEFRRARRLQLNYVANLGGVYVTHVDDGGVGKVSSLELTASPAGQLPTNQLSAGFILPPTFRQKQWTVTASYGGADKTRVNERLSGNSPTAIAVDEMYNFGANPNQLTNFNGGVGRSILLHSSKGAVLTGLAGLVAGAPYTPKYMFVALDDTGKIDVIDLETRAIIRTIDLSGVQVLAGYWRQ